MIRSCLLAVLVLTGLLGAAFAAPNTRERIVLERFTSPQGHAYQVAVGACRQDECEIEVRLVAGDRVIQRHQTGWLVASRRSTRDDFTAAGLVVEPGGTHVLAWRFGEPGEAVLIGARPIRLAQGVDALLLVQLADTEPIRREFMIVGVDQGRLRRFWSGGDGAAGPWASWIERRPMQAQGDRLTFFRVMAHPERGQLDTVVWRQLVWSASLRRLVEQPARDVRTVIAGRYPDAAAARVALERAGRPSVDLWILASDRVQPRQGGGPVVIATVTSIEPRAQQLLAQVRRSGFERAVLARSEPSPR
jgi:hypothetical protein